MATASLAAHNNNKHTHIYRKGKWQMAKPLTNTERTWQPKYKMALGCIQKGLSGIDKSFKNFHTFVVSSSLLAVATLLSPFLSLSTSRQSALSLSHAAAGHLRRFVPSFVAVAGSFITVNLCFGAVATFVMPQKGGGTTSSS